MELMVKLLILDFNMKNNKIWIFLSIYIFTSLCLMYIKYEEFNYKKKIAVCDITKDNKQIGICGDDNKLEEYSRLLYLRSKNIYITGGTTLRSYWAYAISFKDTEKDHSIILEIAKKCLDTDYDCLDVYINEKNPSKEEKLLLYDKYLNKLNNVCEDIIKLNSYIKIANELNINLKYKNNCVEK